MYRGFIPFDTSSLPDNAIISSSTVYMYVTGVQNDYNDAYDYITMYQGFQANSSSLVVEDWDTCGNAITNPTKGSADVDLTSIATGAYQGWTLNSTGRGWISATSSTKLCFREGHDTANVELINSDNIWRNSRIDVKAMEASGTSNDPYLEIVYSFPNTYPATTTELQVEGKTNPTNVTQTSPRFTGRYNDADVSDVAPYYQIQVATSSSYWGAPIWDSAKTAFATSTVSGEETSAMTYGGSPLLLDASTYYWRMKLWDLTDDASPWTTGTAHFTMSPDGNLLQKLHYTYDPVGNITQILSTASSTVQSDFVYDDLNRLTSYTASTTVGTTTQTTSQSYTYNILGNFLTNSPVGTYAYAGTNYANPHAATSIGTGIATSTLAYDNNGNLTSRAGNTYTWDYRNRLTGSVGSSTLSYAYDHLSQRVRLGTATTTTYYPNQFYTRVGTTTEKDLYANGVLVASISNISGATTTEWVHVDHLSGTHVVSDPSGQAIQNTTYYPFGALKIDAVGTAFNQSKKYIGQEYDPHTQLSYLNARFYNPQQGQFLNQDPVFWEVGQTMDGKTALKNPQSLNSYAYANGNPILNKDPQGRAAYVSNSGWTLNTNDTDPNTYYESNDVSMLNTNAAYMAAISDSPMKFEVFREKMWPVKGEWDFKKGAAGYKKDYYFFDGELVDAETFGNLHYGYVGSAGKFKPGTLKGAAGVAQVVAGTSRSSFVKSNFDDPADQRNIQRGIDSYNRSLKSASSHLSSASKALKSGNINAAIKALTKAQRALR